MFFFNKPRNLEEILTGLCTWKKNLFKNVVKMNFKDFEKMNLNKKKNIMTLKTKN